MWLAYKSMRAYIKLSREYEELLAEAPEGKDGEKGSLLGGGKDLEKDEGSNTAEDGRMGYWSMEIM